VSEGEQTAKSVLDEVAELHSENTPVKIVYFELAVVAAHFEYAKYGVFGDAVR
jgi:hypothetical protein